MSRSVFRAMGRATANILSSPSLINANTTHRPTLCFFVPQAANSIASCTPHHDHANFDAGPPLISSSTYNDIVITRLKPELLSLLRRSEAFTSSSTYNDITTTRIKPELRADLRPMETPASSDTAENRQGKCAGLDSDIPKEKTNEEVEEVKEKIGGAEVNVSVVEWEEDEVVIGGTGRIVMV
jgi:hypothetical protein